MKADIEVHGQVVGDRDVRRALRGVEAEALHRALADTRRTVDKAVLAAVESILNTVDTSGAGMPYKHNPHTDARVHTGSDRKSVV